MSHQQLWAFQRQCPSMLYTIILSLILQTLYSSSALAAVLNSRSPATAFLGFSEPLKFDYTRTLHGGGRLNYLKSELYAERDNRVDILRKMSMDTTPQMQHEAWNPRSDPLLEIRDLRAEAAEDSSPILNGVNIQVGVAEVHAIMGRNGSGKSTLSKVLAGSPNYIVTGGTVTYKGMDLLAMPVDHRAVAGVFLGFQYPLEIPMVSGSEMLRTAFNERRKWQGLDEMDAEDFEKLVEPLMKVVQLPFSFLHRPLNYGFSGGEKKRNELLQLLVLKPSLALLDEADSGLDVDSFSTAATAIRKYANTSDASFLITTHYRKLLEYIPPHRVHVMHQGRVVESGGFELATHIEARGFGNLIDADEQDDKSGAR